MSKIIPTGLPEEGRASTEADSGYVNSDDLYSDEGSELTDETQEPNYLHVGTAEEVDTSYISPEVQNFLSSVAEQVNQKQEEIDELTQQVDALEQRLTEYEELKEQNSRLAKDLENRTKLFQESDERDAKLAEYAEKIKELELQLNQKSRQLEQAREDIESKFTKQYSEQIQQLTKSQVEARSQLANLSSQNENLRAWKLQRESEDTKVYDALKVEYDATLAAKEADFRKAREEMDSVARQWRVEKGEMTQQSSELQSELVRLAEEKKTTDYKLQNLEEELARIKEQQNQTKPSQEKSLEDELKPSLAGQFSAMEEQADRLKQLQAMLDARQAEYAKLLKALQGLGIIAHRIELFNKDGRVNDDLLKELQQKKSGLTGKEEENKRLTDELNAQKLLLEAANKNNDELRKKLQDLTSQLAQLDAKKQRVAQLEAENSRLAQRIAEETAQHKQQVADLTNKNSSLQRQLDESLVREKELQEKLGALSQADEQRQKLEDELLDLRSAMRDIASQLDVIKIESETQKTEIEQKNAELTEVRAELENIKRENENLRGEKTALEQKFNDAQEASKEAQRQIDELKDQVQAMNVANEQFQADINKEREEKADLERRLREMEEDLRKEKAESQAKQEQINLAEMIESENKTLSEELQNVRSGFADLQEKYAQLQLDEAQENYENIVSRTKGKSAQTGGTGRTVSEELTEETNVDEGVFEEKKPVTPIKPTLVTPIKPTSPIIDLPDANGVDEVISMDIPSAIENTAKDIFKYKNEQEKGGCEKSVANALVTACAKYSLMKKYVTENQKSDKLMDWLAPNLENQNFFTVKLEKQNPKPELVLSLAERNVLVNFYKHHKGATIHETSNAFMVSQGAKDDVKAVLKEAFENIDLSAIKNWARNSPLISDKVRIPKSAARTSASSQPDDANTTPSSDVKQPISFLQLSPRQRAEQIDVK